MVFKQTGTVLRNENNHPTMKILAGVVLIFREDVSMFCFVAFVLFESFPVSSQQSSRVPSLHPIGGKPCWVLPNLRSSKHPSDSEAKTRWYRFPFALGEKNKRGLQVFDWKRCWKVRKIDHANLSKKALARKLPTN